jgi:tetratricopeptide (TPR) repeat protein
VAQIAATIGREFSHSLLSAVAGLSEESLQKALEDLTQSELVFRRGEPPAALYTFKHALVRDIAYGTMLRNRRQHLHGRIAQIFSADPAVAEAQPELLAHHFAEAGRPREAVRWLLTAGQIALTRSANAEAGAHLRKALELLNDWPRGESRDSQELELLSRLGTALFATHGYAAPATLGAYERARELIRVTGERTRQDTVLSGLFVCYYNLASLRHGLEVGREFLDWAKSSGDAIALCIGHRMMAVSYNATGDFAAAARHGEAAVRHYDPERHGPLAWRYIHDLGVAAMCHCAVAVWHLGEVGRAAELIDTAMALALRLNHRSTMGYAHFYAGLLALRNDDRSALARHARRLQGLGREHNLPHWLAWGLAFDGAALLLAGGDAALAQARVDEAVDMAERMRLFVYRPMLLGFRAEALLAARQFDEARAAIDDALASAERTGEHAHDAELWRLKSDVALAANEHAAAEAHLIQSARCARDQRSTVLAMHASAALAALRSRKDNCDGAAAI